MAAYSINVFTHQEGNSYTVAPGVLQACVLTLPEDAALSVKVVHLATNVQDFSLRCWFSTEPGGNPLSAKLELAEWHPRRKAMDVHNLLTTGATAPSSELPSYTIIAEPGTYYLNVLNLVNSDNRFYLSITTA